ncbi:uncharacterized protein TrAtP1_002186 [Trichoderma atroviride]|uniref:Uncharacterized protein n=1 Tax=Hypocrea atroviridis (strain ATCC 20476 / IMI 206040) TaxID=452589 RepID=G9P2Q1_HYPAI|nr:uncharacterized protein TRIATDRAFT_310316 [Trichoderma atroviride IMI 206040]EHK42731.1 hypothetical protein TRIATDRAFT_310316 [Trichoderma atroviride IMI 206040]UKZ60916.1 hypothetical protein TrAtP1_002186 [Trichoderma atroviride]
MIKQNNPEEDAKLKVPPGLRRLFMAFLISNPRAPQGYNTEIQGYNIKIQGYNAKILTKSLRNPEDGDNSASNNPESRPRCSDLTLKRTPIWTAARVTAAVYGISDVKSDGASGLQQQNLDKTSA